MSLSIIEKVGVVMKVGERVSYLRENKGLTQAELAKRVGINKSVMNRIESGERPIRDNEAVSLAKELEVTTDVLLGAENIRKLDMDDLVSIPVVGSIKCGPGGIIYEDVEGFSSYPKSDIDSSHEYIVLNAKGDSMIGDGINDGDLALIQKEPEFVQGKIYAVLLDSEEVTLKRVTKTEDSVILSPSNPKYDTRVVTGSDLESFNIVGRLINIKRNYF